MRIAISADEYSPLIDLLIEEVMQKGHEVRCFGPTKGEEAMDWF